MLRGGTGGDGYISARYETLRERFDQTLEEWLKSNIPSRLNIFESDSHDAAIAEAEKNQLLLEKVSRDLELEDLCGQMVMTLSNGQSRRARIAQALLKRPEILLIDEPYMGLDPLGRTRLSSLLDRISSPEKLVVSTPVVLGLRPQDSVPSWSTHLVYVEDNKVISLGEKRRVVKQMKSLGRSINLEGEESSSEGGILEKAWTGISLRKGTIMVNQIKLAEPLVEMKNVKIEYYNNLILSDFSWTIRRGEKWGLFGPNGSGKTTLTALLTSDHPKSYSLPIKHFSQPRLPQPGKPGISVFDIQARIGISSPELHSFFPQHLTLRRCIESSFAETFLSRPKISSSERVHIDVILDEFRELVSGGNWDAQFGECDLNTQRLALFLRATVPKRDLVIYDEAFSGMREEVRKRCFEFLTMPQGWDEGRQAMVCVSHVSEEVPSGVNKWVRLGEKGTREKAVFGDF